MRLNFACCARDCGDVVAVNVAALLAFGSLPWCHYLRIYIIENGSSDGTRQAVARLAAQDLRVIPIFLDDLDEQFPVRETRLAYCRDRLLNVIKKSETGGLYIPVDLDSGIASSLNTENFRKACHLVVTGACDGVFPVSAPFFYDIHALRARGWCPASCWNEVQIYESSGALLALLAYIRFISSRQKPLSKLQAQRLIPVESSFGGLGVYSLASVYEAKASYLASNPDISTIGLCEHVLFNSSFSRLFIYTELVVAAPPEHIEFRRLPFHVKLWRIVRSMLVDARRFFSALFRCLLLFFSRYCRGREK
jgi:hypothetical protein